ncbi:MAG TPA: DUF4143 domain-containing protein [Ignavibacteria bacterium]
MKPNKVIALFGARRTGKTFLLNIIKAKVYGKQISFDGEDFNTLDVFSRRDLEYYKELLYGIKYLFIDEAQRIPNIGSILKLIVDHIEGISVLISGSSSLDLSGEVGEPLTGRKWTYNLYPVAQCELNPNDSPATSIQDLNNRLILGSYPELMNIKGTNEKKEYLNELVSSYLLKDIISLDNVKASSKIIQILRLLAYQTGSVVSLSEIALNSGLSKVTVDKYVDLLTKVFIIFRVGGFSKNLRKELTKSSKYYFWDNGIRNAIIRDFSDFGIRKDTGQLWENFVISERMKYLSYEQKYINYYFWRTYDKQEIDWIEESDGRLSAYEIKLSAAKKHAPSAWRNAYPESTFTTINKENHIKFIT